MSDLFRDLFDYQKFAKNPKLSKMIEETQMRYGVALSDDDMDMVAAAGEPDFEKELNEYDFPTKK